MDHGSKTHLAAIIASGMASRADMNVFSGSAETRSKVREEIATESLAIASLIEQKARQGTMPGPA